MSVVGRDEVRALLESPSPDATLVLVGGRCEVVPESRAEGLVIVSRRDLEGVVGDGPMDDRRLGELADQLDTVARDLGA
ncbi:hypothetical protein GCM10010116_32010 [Microbispora rosea subsp. aerata]|nr:hypothetical protein [Microbispora rosea]GGO15914.1 hypothetical protein GCM10010116_32010 [Microbispora rosea subsp. aerata]GIH55806.1 hypothetical protein Mro02_27200 [Microbispora rosea subsp. aerata]GLJ83281.1 hypothetical protein GCM10017588_20080 [Microbispora rosea subsp. aerata]